MPNISEESILVSIRGLFVEKDDTSFDDDLIMHINSAFMILNQLGVGVQGFMISDDTSKWVDFLGSSDCQFLAATKTYVFDSVKLIFDPPGNAFLVSAIEKRMKEYEWRLNSQVDPVAYNV
jgi:hypothetical protein